VTTTEPSIAEQVGVLQTQLVGRAPAEVLAPFHAEQADLDAAGVPNDVARAGDAMPDGALVDAHGRATTLEQTRAGQAAVVVFYRGAWCPYCNIALRAYQAQLLPALTERGVKLVAISPQKPDGSLTAAQTNELSFEVLSDAGNQIAGRLGILTRPTDGARTSQRALGVDVAGANGDGTDTLPMPTTVLVDAEGIIRWIDVHPNYTTRSEPTAILAAVAAQLG
jgi:peroxiredoxin